MMHSGNLLGYDNSSMLMVCWACCNHILNNCVRTVVCVVLPVLRFQISCNCTIKFHAMKARTLQIAWLLSWVHTDVLWKCVCPWSGPWCAKRTTCTVSALIVIIEVCANVDRCSHSICDPPQTVVRLVWCTNCWSLRMAGTSAIHVAYAAKLTKE